jgi:hypothetical protein
MSYFYRSGNLGIVIVSLHDGKNKSLNIKKRSFKNKITKNRIVLVNDTNTRYIASKIRNMFIDKTNNQKVPYLLINNIHRKFVDLNRPLYEGTNSKEGEYYWNKFHLKLENIIMECKKKYGHCLIFDIHGNQKTKDLIELGYGISMIQLGKKKNLDKSSLKFLSKHYSIINLLIGERSLGNYLDDFLHTAPGPILYNKHLIKTIAKDKFYYNGGYVTKTYSKKYKIDAIQVELSDDLRTNNKITYISNILTLGILKFYLRNYMSILTIN